MNEKKLYTQAIHKWGMNAQLDMMVEECAELIQAIQHSKRHRVGREIHEELADVEIMLGQMRCIFDERMIDDSKRWKLERLAERLKVNYHREMGK